MSLINNIKCSRLYSKMECAKCNAEDKLKRKVKDEIGYAKEHPGKTAAKLATNLVVDTIIPAGRVINPAVKYVTKKVIDKDRVKSL